VIVGSPSVVMPSQQNVGGAVFAPFALEQHRAREMESGRSSVAVVGGRRH
jgi:hypothetical protein